MTSSIPHTCLFPRMTVVVHHEGIGTTAAGMAAGILSIITSFFADQPFWGQRVYQLGVDTRPIAQRRLTAENLAQALDRALSDVDEKESCRPRRAHSSREWSSPGSDHHRTKQQVETFIIASQKTLPKQKSSTFCEDNQIGL